LVLASDASHDFSPLDCCGEKPENLIGAWTSGLPLRFELARLLFKQKPGRLVSDYSIGGGGIAFTSRLRRLSVVVALGRSYLTP